MGQALEELRQLDGAAEGPAVREALERVRGLLPETLQGTQPRSDAYELALSLGEQLCPLMFSHDEAVAVEARKGLTQLGGLFGGQPAKDSDASLLLSLQHLCVDTVCTLSVKRSPTIAHVELLARDVAYAVLGSDAPRNRPPLPIKLLLEDLTNAEVVTLGAVRVGDQRSANILRDVPGDPNLDSKLVTVFAGGREIYRTQLEHDAEFVFVI
jgi:hypothetical protein